MGTMILMTAEEGDRRVPWDPTDPAQVGEARQRFDDYISKGFRAYRVARRGQRGERITEFDPDAGEILFTGRAGFVGG